MQFAACTINPARRELTRDGMVVPVEPKTFELLLYLIAHRDRVVGKDELQDKVWGTIVSDAALTRAIMKARKAVGDDTSAAKIIKTVPRVGYRFVAEIDNRAELANSQPQRSRNAGALPSCHLPT